VSPLSSVIVSLMMTPIVLLYYYVIFKLGEIKRFDMRNCVTRDL
jgi:hypothetical protein